MQFSTYLFDFDGTLCDTRESLVPVFRAGFERVGVHATPEDCERWMHLNLYQTLVQSGIPEEQYQTVVDGILDALDMPESIALIKPFEDTVSTLQALLDSGKRIGIVSNNTSTHIRLVLHEMGIDIPFDCIVGSDMFSHGKPHPEPIEVALCRTLNAALMQESAVFCSTAKACTRTLRAIGWLLYRSCWIRLISFECCQRQARGVSLLGAFRAKGVMRYEMV